VSVELQHLDNRFETALAEDCPLDLCHSNGCVYLDHQVADQPRGGSMPGLGEEEGPGSVVAQAYLTRAQCSFSHEAGLDAAQAAALVRRLQTRLTQGWTVVSVERAALPPIPESAEATPPPPVTEAPPGLEPEDPSPGRELWLALLPHTWWMVLVGLLTLAATALIWVARRVGVASIEERALLMQLTENRPTETPKTVEASTSEPDADYVAKQEIWWRERLRAPRPSGRGEEHPTDPALTALIQERLRAGDLPLLAKAVLRLPEGFLTAFPVDGSSAMAKLDLAATLRTVDGARLPSDADFFRAMERHVLAATLATQPDASVVRGLREDFGAGGLVEVIGRLPDRLGALLFAQSPPTVQQEAARLLSVDRISGLARSLMGSNRMDPSEIASLLTVLRDPGTPPVGVNPTRLLPLEEEITDRGATFDAPGALAVLLPHLAPARVGALFAEVLARFQGYLPLWHREIFLPQMLDVLDVETRADLLLALDVDPLAAWLGTQPASMVERVLESAPQTLRRTLLAVVPPANREARANLANQGRRALARGFQEQIARRGIPFEQVVRFEVKTP